MNWRRIAAGIAVAWASVSTAGAPDDAAYGALPTHKAMATAAADPSIRGIASGEPSDEAASVAALTRCNAALRVETACEVTRLNALAVTSGAAMRARVPRGTHPLFLWKFASPTSTLYLAGSIHVMKATLFPLPAQFDAAFDRSDRLVVEVNTDAIAPEALREKVRAYAFLPQGQSLTTVLRPESVAALSAYLQSQNAAVSDVASLKPALVATQLSVARLSALGYLPEFGLERHFESRLGQRPVLQLETIEEQLDVLTSPPMSVQDELLAETLDQMDTIEPIVTGMVVAWLSGDDQEFRRLFDLENGDSPNIIAFSRRLVEDRNVSMATKIADHLRTPGTTFVLVGAAHLTGPEGIVALLERRGLRGQRISTDDSI